MKQVCGFAPRLCLATQLGNEPGITYRPWRSGRALPEDLLGKRDHISKPLKKGQQSGHQ